MSTAQPSNSVSARGVDKKILDLFWQLREENQGKQNAAVNKLNKFLDLKLQKSNNGEISPDLKYCISRLVKGLAAASDVSRRGFLMCLEKVMNGKHPVSVDFFHEHIKNDLQISGALSKSEVTDMLRAQILAYRTILASGKVSASAVGDDVTKIIEAGSQKEILASIAAQAVSAVLDKISSGVFKESVWPTLQPFICIPWPNQSAEKLNLLLQCQEKFPMIVTSKGIKKLMGVGDLLSNDTYPHVAKLLLNCDPSSTFPQNLFSQLERTKKAAEFLPVLQETLEEQSKQKSISYLNFLITLVEKGDPSYISLVLTPSTCKILGEKTTENEKQVDRLTKAMQQKIALPEVTDDVQSAVAKALAKAAKNSETSIFAFGLLQVLMGCFRAEALKKICSLLKKVIEDNEQKTKDRIMALHQLKRAVVLPALKNETAFIEKTINKLLAMAYKSGDCPRELAVAIREQVIKIIESPSSKVEQWCVLLTNAVSNIDASISGDYFKKPEAKKSWDSVIARLTELNALEEKDWCQMIFLVIYAHVAFLLLQDPSVTDEVLPDLDKCFEKSQKKKSKKRKSEVPDSEPSEPSWVEVMTDMLLYLLGQQKASLRNMCCVVWKLLVPHLTDTALQTVLDVMKFTEEDDVKNGPPPSKKQKTGESDDESDEWDEESGESGESDVDMDDEDGKGGSDQLIKLKMDLHKALGENAALTDQESIDLDEMDDEAMKAVDDALAMAFKAHKEGKRNKKQTKHEAKDAIARMHLRIRALDLIDITTEQTSNFRLIQMMIIPLAESFAESVRSTKQSQLQTRLKIALRNLRDWKPKDGISNVDTMALIETLRQLLAIAQANTTNASTVTEGLSYAFSCVMRLALHSEKSATAETPKKKPKISKQILSLLSETLEDFATGKAATLPSYFIYKALDIPWPLRPQLFGKLVDVCFKHPEIGKLKRISLLSTLRNAVKAPPVVTEALEGDENLIETLYKHSAEMLSATEYCKPEHVEIFETLNCLQPKVKTLESMNAVSEELKKAVIHYHDNVPVSKAVKDSFIKLMTSFGLKFTQKKSDQPKQQPTVVGVPKTPKEKKAEKRKKMKEKMRAVRAEVKAKKAEKRKLKKLAKENGEMSADNETVNENSVTPEKRLVKKQHDSDRKKKVKVNGDMKPDGEEQLEEAAESKTPKKSKKLEAEESLETVAEGKSAKKVKKEKREAEEKTERDVEPKSAKKNKKQKSEGDENFEPIVEATPAKKAKDTGSVSTKKKGTEAKSTKRTNLPGDDATTASPIQKTPKLRRKSAVNLDE